MDNFKLLEKIWLKRAAWYRPVQREQLERHNYDFSELEKGWVREKERGRQREVPNYRKLLHRSRYPFPGP